jgi:peptidyl-prolyl cis-trans isomerase A (cyclophilin A)
MKAILALVIAASIAMPALAQTAKKLPAKPVPAALAKPAADVMIEVNTTMGRMVFLLNRQKAPITAGNFYKYATTGRFTGTSFYRRVQTPGTTDKGFIQGGTTDPKRVLPPIAHEPTTLTGLSHVDGALSAPRWAPGTARGDFTIMSGDAKWMDADPKASGDNLGYAVFGRVVEGMDVVKKILAAPVSTTKGEGVMRGQMLEPQVKIISMKLMPPIMMPPTAMIVPPAQQPAPIN